MEKNVLWQIYLLCECLFLWKKTCFNEELYLFIFSMISSCVVMTFPEDKTHCWHTAVSKAFAKWIFLNGNLYSHYCLYFSNVKVRFNSFNCFNAKSKLLKLFFLFTLIILEKRKIFYFRPWTLWATALAWVFHKSDEWGHIYDIFTYIPHSITLL